MAFGQRDMKGAIEHEGSPLVLILIIAPLILLALTFFMNKIKAEAKQTFLFKNIFIVTPVFNITAALTLRVLTEILLKKAIADRIGDINMINFNLISGNIGLRISYGFILYIFLNILLLIAASVNYFNNIKRE